MYLHTDLKGQIKDWNSNSLWSSMLEPDKSKRSDPKFDSILHDKRSQAFTCGILSSIQSSLSRKRSLWALPWALEVYPLENYLGKEVPQAWKADSGSVGIPGTQNTVDVRCFTAVLVHPSTALSLELGFPVGVPLNTGPLVSCPNKFGNCYLLSPPLGDSQRILLAP